MNVAAIQSDSLMAALTGAGSGGGAIAAGDGGFADLMTRSLNPIAKPASTAGLRQAAGDGVEAAGDAAIEAKAREAATQFVASAFLMPVMKTLHDSPFAAGPFAPSSAEQRFAPMLDWQFADRIASAEKFPLVDAIVRRIMQHAADAEGVSRAVESATASARGSLDVSG